MGRLLTQSDLDGLAGAGFDERGREGWGRSSTAGGGNVAVDLGVDLLHGDGEGAVAVLESGTERFGDREGVDEGRQLEGVEHRRADTRRIGLCWLESCMPAMRHGFLGQGALSGVEQAEGRGLVQEGASGRRQRTELHGDA